MKRLLGFIFFISLTIALGIMQENSIIDYFEHFSECIISTSDTFDNDTNAIKNGNQYILRLNKNNYQQYLSNVSSIESITLRVDNMKVNEIVKTLHIDIKNISYIYDCKVIDGYTDTTGDYITNLDLSQRRAFAVAEYLMNTKDSFLSSEESAILTQKLTANGRSMSNPILDEYGNVDMDASRRVEIKFRLKDEEMMAELQEIIEETKIGGETS